MEKSVIHFKKSHLCLPFVIGGATMACGTISTIYGSMSMAGLVAIGGMWIGIALHKYFSGYFTLGHSFLQVNDSPFVRRIDVSDIREVKFFAGDWIVKYGKDKEIYINPNLCEQVSVPILENFFRTLQAQVAK